MPPAVPPFPGFEEWKRMSEREQDALLDRLEAKKRRGAISRLAIGLGCVAAAAAAAGYVILVLA